MPASGRARHDHRTGCSTAEILGAERLHACVPALVRWADTERLACPASQRSSDVKPHLNHVSFEKRSFSSSGSRRLNACRRSGSARPSSFLAFFHDSLRRCRAVRIVSRQSTNPNRSPAQPTRRRSVQRGAGLAPPMGGVAAVRWAVRTTWPSSASRRGQKRDGDRPCGGT